MGRAIQNAVAAAALIGISLYLWREGYQYSDWAVVALLPAAVVIWTGFLPLVRDTWRARLHTALREESPLGKILTGKLRAHLLSGLFTTIAITLLAWRALSVTLIEVTVLATAIILSATLFSIGLNWLSKHFHRPFARSIAASVVTWTVAFPFTLAIAWTTWEWSQMPGAMLNASLYDAMNSGLGELPDRGGLVTNILGLLSGYEAAKLWIVIQLREYPFVGVLFSLDAALYAFVLCRSAIVIALFVETLRPRRTATSILQGHPAEHEALKEIFAMSRPAPHLGRWFWGAFIVMAGISIGLSISAMLRSPPDIPEATLEAPTAQPIEMSAGKLHASLSVANQRAVAEAKALIPSVLEEAYRPVYAGIPVYADFHYSVWGQYAELSAAAIGDVGSKLQETLFDGFDSRLEKVALDLDAVFNEAYLASVEEEITAATRDGSSIGNLTRTAITDSRERMMVTAPVATAAAAATGVTTKAASAAIAKNMAAKLAVKAAAKTGGKWAAASAAAGSGALLCSWTGPGAALCAAAGGVGAWVAADYGIVRIDEYWNRADFEADLRSMIDEQKTQHSAALERAIDSRSLAVKEESDTVVQNLDFTMRKLTGGTNPEICAIVEDLSQRYQSMRTSIGARNESAMQEIRELIAAHEGDFSLGPLVREIDENLNSAHRARITEVKVSGNLPTEFRADRDVTIQLILDGKRYQADRIKGSQASGFATTFNPDWEISINAPTSYGVAIEQHVRFDLFSNRKRYFGGSSSVSVSDALGGTSALVETLKLRLPISRDEQAETIEDVVVSPTEGARLFLSFQLHAEALLELHKSPSCS